MSDSSARPYNVGRAIVRITADLLLPEDFDTSDLSSLSVECVDVFGYPNSLDAVIQSSVVEARLEFVPAEKGSRP